MAWDLCEDLMFHLGADDLSPGHAPDDVKAWLETLGLELGFLRFMQWNWPQESGDLGVVHLYSSRRMKDDEDSALFARHRLLSVGYAINGDPFVLDFSSDPVVPCFISHEEFWPDRIQDPRKWMARLAPSLAAFWWRQAEGLYVPADFNLASDLNNVLGSESRDMRGPNDPPA